jgi:hypothetical protein
VYARGDNACAARAPCGANRAATQLHGGTAMTHSHSVALVAVAASFVACGGNPGGPSPASALSEQIQTSAYNYRFAPGDTVDVAWQEGYHAWAVETLGLQNVRRITYQKYFSRQHMGEVIGVSNTNGFADAETFTIHTIWPTDNHEVVHLYSSAWGRPVALFSEGFAVAFSVDPARGQFVPIWHSQPVHSHARAFRSNGTIIPLSRLAETNGFRSFDPNITYPQAGSFVRYLVDTHGLEPIRRVFAALRAMDPAAAVNQAVVAAYGKDLSALEADWLQFLANGA